MVNNCLQDSADDPHHGFFSLLLELGLLLGARYFLLFLLRQGCLSHALGVFLLRHGRLADAFGLLFSRDSHGMKHNDVLHFDVR